MSNKYQNPSERSSAQNFSIALGIFIILSFLFDPMIKYLLKEKFSFQSRKENSVKLSKPSELNTYSLASGNSNNYSPGHQLALIELGRSISKEDEKVKDFEYLLRKIEEKSSGYSQKKIADMIVVTQKLFREKGFDVSLERIAEDLLTMQKSSGGIGLKIEELLGAYVTLATTRTR
jgi:hypothetical protein